MNSPLLKRRSFEENPTDQIKLLELAENAVERGVNEITQAPESMDDEFKVEKASATKEAQKKNIARKKKKTQRQNRKKNRR